MQLAPRFLVVDFHSESRFLLVRTLLRKFPTAEILEEDDVERALARVREGRLSAAIIHRTFDVSGAELVQQIRALDPTLCIVMVSGVDRAETARLSGANTFLHYDEWLRIGSVVDQEMNGSAAPFSPDAPNGGGAEPEVPLNPSGAW